MAAQHLVDEDFNAEDEVFFYNTKSESNPKPFHANTWSRGQSARRTRRRTQSGHNRLVPTTVLTKGRSVENSSDFHLSILDLQTLRRDSQVEKLPGNSEDPIRPPQQDVFRLHKPQFHISSERVWFPRDLETQDPGESPEESFTTLADEEVEVKLPCRSVSINVVGMPSNGGEVNAGAINASLQSPVDFQETFQPLLMTPGRGATVPLGLQPQQQPPPRSLNLNGLKKEAALEAVSSLEKDNPKLESPCCRYRKPFTVSLISVGLIMFITFLVLYWNYYETIHRRMTKKQGYILDHWGKGSPSAAETAVLDQEVEVLKQEMEEASQKKIPSTVDTNSLINKVLVEDDLLYIDGRSLNSYLTSSTATFGTRTTSKPAPRLDSRVD